MIKRIKKNGTAAAPFGTFLDGQIYPVGVEGGVPSDVAQSWVDGHYAEWVEAAVVAPVVEKAEANAPTENADARPVAGRRKSRTA